MYYYSINYYFEIVLQIIIDNCFHALFSFVLVFLYLYSALMYFDFGFSNGNVSISTSAYFISVNCGGNISKLFISTLFQFFFLNHC